MKLFFSTGACSLIVRIIINELGLNAEYDLVDLQNKKTASGDDYLKINIKGAVPALEIKPGQILTENSIILQYLADTNPSKLLPALDDFNRYRTLEWLNYIATDIHKGFGPFFNKKMPDNIKNEFFLPLLKSKFMLINQHLKNKKHLMGEEFTLPDAYLFVMLFWSTKLNLDFVKLPELDKYYHSLLTRESIMRSLKAEKIHV